MRNPTKHIREAYYNAITGLGYDTYIGSIPLDQELNGFYVIIATQDKQQQSLCKRCPEMWNVSITINIIDVQEAGQNNRLAVDDAEDAILNVINECSGLSFDWFDIKETTIANSFDDDLELPTQFMNRQVCRIEHEIHEKDTI